MTETTTGGVAIPYVYDNARVAPPKRSVGGNRLTSVDGIAYTWDDNGNLLSDGGSAYTYDKANRLKTLVQGGTTDAYTYNGQGDRLRQTVNGTPTTYTLDLNAGPALSGAEGLTQVLGDGSNVYLYGASRIGEKQPGGWRYYTTDALGSLRQLVDNTGAVTLAKSYRPFGALLTSNGTGASVFGYTNEYTSQGLIDLRSRFYSPSLSQFIQPDTIIPDPSRPRDWNKYIYVQDNPVNFTDPSGHGYPGPTHQHQPINIPLPDRTNLAQILNNYSGKDSPDLTDWLLVAMQQNALSPTAKAIKLALSSEYMDDKINAYVAWYNSVKSGAPWDFKVELDRYHIGLIILGNQTLRFDALANIHFGYVGRASGFNSIVLEGGAGIAQIKGNTSDIHWGRTFFDDPEDNRMIRIGVWIYDTFGIQPLTVGMLNQAFLNVPAPTPSPKLPKNYPLPRYPSPSFNYFPVINSEYVWGLGC